MALSPSSIDKDAFGGQLIVSNPVVLSDSSNDTDRISSLPDKTLSHILSFLPTKDAVLTRILSTRWRYIWALVPTLDFDDSLIPSSKNLSPNVSFMNFVDRVLFLRSTTIKIQKFHLSCHHKCDPYRFNTWICYVIVRDVPDLCLSYCCPTEGYVHLPQSLFACEMLEVLKLNMDFHVHIPDSVFLPSLRVLHLTAVSLNDCSLENLIRCCPVLEELVIDNLDKKYSFWSVKICSSSLKSLKMHTNIVSCRGSLSIDAPSLEYIDIAGHVLGTYYVTTLSSVVKAIVDVFQLHFERDDGEENLYDLKVLELFRGICNVKHLAILSRSVTNIFCLRNRILPTFGNLTHLEVRINCWGSLRGLLKCSSEVTDLVVEMDYEQCLFGCSEHWWDKPDCVAKCLSKLEMIEIRVSYGSQNKMEVSKPQIMGVAKYFLQNSIALKKMTFGFLNMTWTKKLIAQKELLRFLGGSRISALVFS